MGIAVRLAHLGTSRTNAVLGLHFSDKRVYQDLTRKLSLFVDLSHRAT
jgi:hypothetical protein